MKKLLTIIAAAAFVWQIQAGEIKWLSDLPAAQAQAKAEKKIVLMDFTGSDWCPWCIKFRKEVLDAKEFRDYATTNVVSVELDFPHKSGQSDELKAANKALKDKYKIGGFPTLVVLDQDGKEIGRQEGYEEGRPTAFIAKLEKFKGGK
jgi:protein disulfide-isomerase